MEKTDSSPLSRQALYADKKQWNQLKLKVLSEET